MFSVRVSPLTRELIALAQSGMPERRALISIMDHRRDCPERYPAPRVLRLCFDDAVEDSFWQNLMTEEQADAICAFVLQQRDAIDLLIIHCTEGVSRSAAVAAAVLACCGGDASQVLDNPRFRPNPLVYRLVTEAFARSQYTASK